MKNRHYHWLMITGLSSIISIISSLSYANTKAITTYQSLDQSVTVFINNNRYINRVVFNNEQDSCSVNITITQQQGHLFSNNSVNYSTFQWQLAPSNGAANISGVLSYTGAYGSSYIKWDTPINTRKCTIDRQNIDKRIFPL